MYATPFDARVAGREELRKRIDADRLMVVVIITGTVDGRRQFGYRLATR